MKIRRWVAYSLVLFLSIMPCAFAKGRTRAPMDKILYRVSTEQWVTTNIARVVVSISATMDKSSLAKARSTIMSNLNQIANGKWHITRFDRSQDSSGLERLSVQAEARIPEKGLASVRSHAKSVSKPGATYRIVTIDFTPSLKEVEIVREQVRAVMLNTIKQELKTLNGIYPEQKFTVYRINFLKGAKPAYPAAKRMRGVYAMAQQAVAISVSNKVNMTALVIFATQRKIAQA